MTRKVLLSRYVRAGIEALDTAWPGWALDVDPDSLNVHSTGSCVLAQLSPTGDDYSCGLETLFGALGIDILPYSDESDRWAVRHGFDAMGISVGDGTTGMWQLREYEVLTRMWRVVVKARTAGTVSRFEGLGPAAGWWQ